MTSRSRQAAYSGVHRSSYRYWKNRPEKPDGRRAVLRSQVLELHGISHGSRIGN
ncbi:putative transposase [Shigella sonnei str. Moseley]|nr:putative transposase [Shigella sonnei str. Moseley]EJL11828.1 putative transposase [Shigella sonnei str. Moseley]